MAGAHVAEAEVTVTGRHRADTMPLVVLPEDGSWKPGDPCGACGSDNTAWDVVLGGVCGHCGATDADE